MGAMNDFFGEPPFQPTGTDWIDHAFTAVVLDEMEQEERTRHSCRMSEVTTDRTRDSDADITPVIYEYNSDDKSPGAVEYREAVDFFVDMAIEPIKQEYEALGDWWTVCPTLEISYQSIQIWFIQKSIKSVFMFPSQMPLDVLCNIRENIELWLKTKCDEYTFVLTNPMCGEKVVSTSLIHYTPGTDNTDALMELKTKLKRKEISKRKYKKYVSMIQTAKE